MYNFCMSRLNLRLFGLPRFEVDGQPVVTDRRKALALLIYLSINGMDYTREALATLLWPDQDTSHVLAYLRRTLWEINQTFGAGLVRTERDIVGLYPEARSQMWIDVSRFRTLVAQSRAREQEIIPLLEEAVRLYRDDFLAGFNLKDASLYEDWVGTQSAALKKEYFFALEALAQACAKRNDLSGAIASASDWVEKDELNESAHCLLMELYARNGQVGAAIRQYQLCAHVLLRELGLEPSQQTKTLFEQLKKEAGHNTTQKNLAGGMVQTRRSLSVSTYSTSFFGRRNELAELEKMLRDPDVHLVTIMGPGGAGKTRLALEAGRIYSQIFNEGACFVPLAAVARPEYVISAIADALGLRFTVAEARSQVDQLAEMLSSRHILLILDNMEHLQAGSRMLPEVLDVLLRSAPRLTILATSHERLNMEQEWVLNVGGMPVPAIDAGDWEQYGAVQLFIQNARKASGKLRLSGADRRAIIRICQLVGGLPLGLELAAAWVKILSCEEIASEIERGLDFLKTPLKNVVERHQSLRATFEYSWSFLSEIEQGVLMRLAVFQGGFKREAALTVAEAPLSLLSELANKSLIQRDEGGRFNIHQSLKPFVLEKLGQHNDLIVATSAQHGEYFAKFTQEHNLALRGHGQRNALDEITEDLDNVLSGWQWALTNGSESNIQSYLEGLLRFFDIRCRFHDAESLFGRAVAEWLLRKGSENTIYGLLLAGHAWFLNRVSHISQAHQQLLQSLELLRRLNTRPELMFVNSLALYIVPKMDDSDEIERIAQESLAFYQEQNDRWGMAQVLPFFHRIKTPQGLRDAINLHNETIQIFRDSGDTAGLAATLTSLGELLHYSGDYEKARRSHQSGLELARELNDRRAIAASLDYLGFINRQLGEFDLARVQHMESMEISKELGNSLGIAGSLDNLGLVALDLKHYAEALELFQQALPLRRDSGQKGSVAISLEHIANAALYLTDLPLVESSLKESLSIFADDLEWATTSHAFNRFGDMEMLLGNFSAAERYYRTSLKQALSHDSISVMLDTTLCIASLAIAQDHLLRAVELGSYVAHHPSSEFALKERARELLAKLAAVVDEQVFLNAVSGGQYNLKLTPDW